MRTRLGTCAKSCRVTLIQASRSLTKTSLLPRVTTEVVAEPFSQTVIPRDIHFKVVVKELANVCLSVWGDHGGLPAVGPEYDHQ
jgi:hypothetical protein